MPNSQLSTSKEKSCSTLGRTSSQDWVAPLQFLPEFTPLMAGVSWQTTHGMRCLFLLPFSFWSLLLLIFAFKALWKLATVLFNRWVISLVNVLVIFVLTNRPNKVVWHGADRHGIRHTEGYCDAWNSNSRHRTGLVSNLLRGKLLDQEKNPCNTLGIILCVEISTTEDINWASRSKRSPRNSTEASSSNINLFPGLDFDASDYEGEEWSTSPFILHFIVKHVSLVRTQNFYTALNWTRVTISTRGISSSNIINNVWFLAIIFNAWHLYASFCTPLYA